MGSHKPCGPEGHGKYDKGVFEGIPLPNAP